MSSRHDIKAGRLPAEQLAENFRDMHPPLTQLQAAVAASRCLFCHDAPCIEACPTGIDIPVFIRKIATGNTRGAAVTILKQNIMGGTCANVCPVEELCEEVCVKNTSEQKPVEIGHLQRFATDALFATGEQPFRRAPETGHHVAVVGAGPAGLSCAHRLAMHGHRVTVFEALPKAGGLNEYGIAAYKMVDERAAKEVAFILGIGGITIEHGRQLGRDLTLHALREEFDAVFLGLGHNAVNALGIENETLPGVHNAVEYIARIRQQDLETLPVGRRVVVIGGGNTAIDIAVQSRKLGAEYVTIYYRRGQEDMGATEFEQDVAQTNGVMLKTWTRPVEIHADDEGVTGVTFEYTERATDRGGVLGTGEFFTVEADTVFKAIGQYFEPQVIGAGEGQLPAYRRGRIVVDENRRTSLPDVFAGGDCVPGNDLTVVAVEDGKIAAEAIHALLTEQDHG